MQALLLAFLAVFLWSTTPTAAGLSSAYTNYFSLTFFMLLFGLLGMSIPVISNREEYITLSRKITWRGILLVVTTGMAISGYYLCLFYALEVSPRIEASVINFLWPIIFVVLSWGFLEKKRTGISATEVLFLLLAFAGATLVASNGQGIRALTTFHPGYIAAFCAALLAGSYLIMIEKARAFYKENYYVYFSSILSSVPLLYLYHLVTGVELVITGDAIIFYIYMGLIVFCVGQLAWVYATQHYQKVTIASIAYLTPVISIILLAVVLGDSVSATALFGISVILLANIALHSKYWYSTSTMGSFLVLIFMGIACYLIDGREDLQDNFTTIELFGLMFGIIVGFTLQRVSERVREQEWKFNEISESIQVLLNLAEDKLDKEGYRSVRQKVDDLLQKLIAYDYERDPAAKEKSAQQIFREANLLISVNGPEADSLRGVTQEVQAKLGQWILSKSQKLSTGEMSALWALGIAAISSLFISRADTLYGDLATIVFSSSIVLLLLIVRDYNFNRPERDFTKLMVSQEIFRRNGYEYFLPRHVLSSRQLPMPTSRYSFRYGTGKDGRTEREEIIPEPNILNFYKVCFAIGALVALFVLLYFKHLHN